MKIKLEDRQNTPRCINCTLNQSEYVIELPEEGWFTWSLHLCAGCLAVLQGLEKPKPPKPRFEAILYPWGWGISPTCHPLGQAAYVHDNGQNCNWATEACKECAEGIANTLNCAR